MGDLLSSISGQMAVRSIVLGTFFPVVLFVALDILLVGPLVDPETASNYLRRLATGEDKWGAVVLTLIVTAITGILYNLSMPILRLYEGYPWEKSFIGGLFKERKRKKLRKAQALQTGLRAVARGMLGARDPHAKDVIEARTSMAFLLNSRFPDREDLVLPTRLGNLIRNFERYPSVAYGLDAIALWPRFASKIEANTAASLDEAKTSLDFMLNSSFLSFVSAAGVIAIGLSSATPLTAATVLPWLWRAALFVGLFLLFYELSLGRAAAWGSLIKSVFDVYRFDVLTKLGYDKKPETMAEEKALWHQVSQHLLFAYVRGSGEELPPYSAPSLRVKEPANGQIELRRTIENVAGAKLKICILAENLSPLPRETGRITIVEAVPKNFRYVAGSAEASNGSCEIVELEPLTMRLPSLGKGQSATVTYHAEPAPKPSEGAAK